jgi:superfamily II DNA or RNA helicase
VVVTRDEIQEVAVEAIVAERAKGRKSTLMQKPTQTGKTRTSCKYIKRGIAEWNGRFLVCAHMGELLDQFGRELREMGIKYRVEQSGQHAYEWMRLDPSIRVCLGSKDTLQNRGRSSRLDSWPEDFFTDIIFDECDLATATTWRKTRDHFGSAFLLGMTATIDRTDGVPLSTVFESTAFTYRIEDAIRNGHRVPFRTISLDTEIDIRGIKADAKGEFDPGQLAARIGPKLSELANVVRMRFEDLADRGVKKAVAFLPTVPLAELFAHLLTQIGVGARSIHGEDPGREVKIREFREGCFPILCNQKLFGRGFNDPGIGAVIDFLPGNSRAWISQKAGRCGATAPGKSVGYLLYPDWASDQDLVGPTDIFAESDTARVRQVARKLSRLAKESDPQALIEKARELVAEEERQERIAAEKKIRFKAEKRDVRHRFREFDPIGVVGVSGVQLADGMDAGPVDPALAKRLAAIGMDDVRGLSGRDMEEVARFWEDRHACGMATLKQFDYLVRKRKFPPGKVLDMSIRDAGWLMGELGAGRRPSI